MQIPDFPMKHDEGPSFVHHNVIREYLWDYAKYFNLYPHIKVMIIHKNYNLVLQIYALISIMFN